MRAAFAIIVIALAACGGPPPEKVSDEPIVTTEQGIQYGGHLRVGYNLEPMSLDAVLGRSGGDAYYWHQIFDQLVDANKDLSPRLEMSLAKSWDISEDPDSITFYLREGVKFHDGTDFNAEAVKFNIDRILDPATVATPRASLAVIESVEVLDTYTVRFNLKQPWGAGFNMLADRGGVMSSPAQILALGKDYGWNPAGTGPFKVNDVIMGTMVHLVRNEDYWATDEHGNRLPYLDEVTIRVIRDQTVLASALRTGEIDVAYAPHKDVAAFLRDDRFQVETIEGGGIGVVFVFNLNEVDINVRRAIAHTIDPSIINKAIYFNRVQVADSGMWMGGAWSHDPDAPRPNYDLDKAREHFAKSGLESFEFTAVVGNSPILIPAAEIVRQMLKKIGITMNIEVMNAGVATELFFHAEEYPAFFTGWSRYPEPDWLASLAYKSDGYYNAANIPRPDVDALVSRGAGLYDTAARKEVYDELNAIILEEVWFLPLIYSTNYPTAPHRVRNLERLVGWDGKMFLREIWLERE